VLELSTHHQYLLHPDVKDFIFNHLQHDVTKLALKPRKLGQATFRDVLAQISARQKAKDKLPEWSSNLDLLFPPIQNLEQSSSFFTAFHKFLTFSTLHTSADLTGGFGIDTYFLSKISSHVHYVEPNEELACIVAHNFQQLGVQNITYHVSNAESYLSNLIEKLDLFYLDPSRRDSSGQRIYQLEDHEPNIKSLLPSLLDHSNQIIVKTSPMLSITETIRQNKDLAQIQLIEYQNELKEINLLFKQNTNQTIQVISDKENTSISIPLESRNLPVTIATEISGYLLEPSPAWQKSGLFGHICQKYQVQQFGLHTHFMISDSELPSFHGKQWKIISELPIDKTAIHQAINGKKANVVLRNAPLETAEFCKKMDIIHSEPHYLLGGKDRENKFRIFLAERIF